MIKKFLFILVLLFSLFSFSFASVEIINNYDSTIKFLNDNTLSVSKHISIQNINTVGIIPGNIEFKIKRADNSIEFIDSSLKVTNKFGDNIKHKLIKTKDYFIIAVDIYTPILPGFKYNLNIDYNLKYNSKGFLFKSAIVPLKEDLSIPIKNGVFTLILEPDKKFTYLSYRDNNTIINGNKVIYKLNKDTPNELNFEYSKIPLNIFHFKGSYLFWIFINILLLILLLFEFKKELKGISKKKRK